MRIRGRNKLAGGFSLVELLMSSGLIVIVGLIVAAMMQSALTLYVKNFSVNDAHARGRSVTEKLGVKIQGAVQAPVLIDKTGATVAGTGPAAGIQCLVPSGGDYYRTATDTAVTASSMKIAVNSTNLPAPGVDDCVMLQWYDAASTNSGFLFAQISSVSVSGNVATLAFANTVKTYIKPAPASSAVIKSGHPLQVINRVAFIAVPVGGTTKLRYYPKAKTVATQGQSVFDNPANFRELADLVTLPGQTACLPFRYSTADQRYLDLDIRSVSKRYDKRSGSLGNSFDSLRSKIAFRSIIQID